MESTRIRKRRTQGSAAELAEAWGWWAETVTRCSRIHDCADNLPKLKEQHSNPEGLGVETFDFHGPSEDSQTIKTLEEEEATQKKREMCGRARKQ